MSFKPEDYPDNADEHFSAEDAKNFFDALEKGDFAEVESKFQTFCTNAETKVDKFFTSTLGAMISNEARGQIEGAQSMMKDEFAKIKKWFSERMADIKSKPEDAASKMKAFKEEFLAKWADFRRVVAEKTRSVRNLVPVSDKKPVAPAAPAMNAEQIITKAQDAANVVLPKLKNLFALSKAAAAGAMKGIKEMQQKKKDESEKK